MTPRPYPAPRDGLSHPPGRSSYFRSPVSTPTPPILTVLSVVGTVLPCGQHLTMLGGFRRGLALRAPSPCPALQTLALPVTLKLSSSPSPRGVCWPLLRPHCWAPARKLSKAVVLGKHRAPSWIPCLVGIILLYCLTSRTLNTPRSPMLCYCRRQAPKSSPYPCILAKRVSPHF